MKTTVTPAIRRFALSACGVVLAAMTLAAPITASACGPYGPRMTDAQRLVLQAASADVEQDDQFVVEYKRAKIRGATASIWVKAMGPEQTQWRKLVLDKTEDGWAVRAPVVACRS